jgi:hypothetical protein
MSLQSFEKDGYTYFELYVTCPVCREKGIVTPQTQWLHKDNDCGGAIYIGDNACYYCDKCEHTGKLKSVKMECPTHSTSDGYYISLDNSTLSIAEVISCVGQMVSEVGQKWLIKFLENLGDW